MNRSPNFCSLPWTGLDISAQGMIRPCCKYSTPLAQDLVQYHQSQELHELRQAFVQGTRPAGCQRCWSDEDAGLPSKRQLDHQYVLPMDVELNDLQVLALTFGNTCNLACVTCNGSSSSRWLQDERRLINEFDHLRLRRHDKHYRDPQFVDNIISRCERLRHLEISGGEPFFADRDCHLDLLRRIPNPGEVKIHYITNGTVFPDSEFWQVWHNFRHIDVQLSIDAVDQQFEYLRYPAEWSTVWRNIQQYRDQTHIQLSISHTVSWINVWNLDSFITWCLDNNLPRPYVGPVSRPDFLSVRSLPLWSKQRMRDRLHTSTHDESQAMIRYMQDQDTSGHFEQGIRWLQALDHIRGLDHRAVFPEINWLWAKTS